MTRSSTSKLEPFNPKVERTFHKLRNLVREKLSPRNQSVKMDERPTLVGVGAAIGVAGAKNP